MKGVHKKDKKGVHSTARETSNDKFKSRLRSNVKAMKKKTEHTSRISSEPQNNSDDDFQAIPIMKGVHRKCKNDDEASTSTSPKCKSKASVWVNAPAMKTQQQKEARKKFQQENNRGLPMMIAKLYKHMNPLQRHKVDRAGFGGLLNCACSLVVPDLCNWLLECYDPDSSELVFPGRGSIPITEATVHKVLGLPMGGETIRCELDAAATSYMQGLLGVSKGTQPKISRLLAILKGRANSNYLRMWTLLAACSLITPTFSTKVSPRLYPAVIDSTSIGNKNWCELVIRILKQSRQVQPKKHGFKPCLTLLMILYLDSLKHSLKKIPDTGCHITVWITELIRKVVAKDTVDTKTWCNN